MKEKTKNKLKKARDTYCYGDFFLGRGLGIINSIYQIVKYTAFTGIVVGMINEAFGDFHWWIINISIHIPMDRVFFFVPILVIVLILIGVIDVKKIHTLQKMNEIHIRYNPYLIKLFKGRKNNEK